MNYKERREAFTNKVNAYTKTLLANDPLFDNAAIIMSHDDVTFKRSAFLVYEYGFVAMVPEHGDVLVFDHGEVTYSFHGSCKPYVTIPEVKA
jgi:hypothetical protein